MANMAQKATKSERPGAWRAAAVVFCYASVIRIWLLASVSLLITNDSAWYLQWATMLLSEGRMDLPPFRTPGYPIILAGLFGVFGAGPMSILVVQLAAGAISAALLAWIVARLRTPRAAIFWGCVFASDPVFWAYEAAALTEAPSTFLLVLSAAIALSPRLSVPKAITLGLVFGALCLIRPAFQVVAVVLLAGMALSVWQQSGRRTASIRFGAAGAALAIVLIPWCARNYAVQGRFALSGSNGVYLWIGAAQAEVLDFAKVPPSVAASAEAELARDPTDEANIHRFLGREDAWRNPTTRAALLEWTLGSIDERPFKYAAAAATAMGWQLGLFPRGLRFQYNEVEYAVERMTTDGTRVGMPAPNFQFTVPFEGAERYRMEPTCRSVALYTQTVGRIFLWDYFRLPFFAMTIAATVAALWLRRWMLAAVFGGILCYIALHALFLLPNNRYSLPCWALMYAAPPAFFGMCASRKS